MKAMKIALLGTAALAAVSVSARADQLSDLKAQIEALNARVATVEATPAVPAGYQLVSFSKVGNEHIISIMPTADVPASTTVTWTGYVKAGVISESFSNGYSAVDVRTKAGFAVKGVTDTAVGEVGVKIAVQQSQNWLSGYATNSYGEYNGGNTYLKTDGFSGWWKITPNFTLTAGILGNLSKSSYSYDAVVGLVLSDDTSGIVTGPYSGDPAAMRISYADGPLSFAVQLEDGNNYGTSSYFGVTGKVGYTADTMAFDLSGGVWGGPSDNFYAVSAGAKAGLGAFTVGGAIGNKGTSSVNSTYSALWAQATLSDSISAEIGWEHSFSGAETNFFGAGIYYAPVSQLKLGVEGNYSSDNTGYNHTKIGFVSAFSF